MTAQIVGLKMKNIHKMTPIRNILNFEPISRGLSHDLHYWIGSKSSQDEYGAVAIYAAQCDEALGGIPVQYREVEGHESLKFLALFEDIIVKCGGADSGFENAEPNIETIE